MQQNDRSLEVLEKRNATTLDYRRRKAAKKLTPKQIAFCKEWITDKNGTRAATKVGYSKRSATVIASDTLRKAYIQDYIAIITEDYEYSCGITKKKQLDEYAKIAYSSIASYNDSWIEKKDFDKLTEEQKAAVESIETKTEEIVLGEGTGKKKVVYVKVKLYNKLDALKRIDSLLGYDKDRKLTIEANINGLGGVDEVKVREHMIRLSNELSFNLMIIGMVAAKAGKNPVKLQTDLANSYYSKFSGFGEQSDNNSPEEAINLTYNWDDIKKKVDNPISNIEEITYEELTDKEAEKALSYKEKLLGYSKQSEAKEVKV